VIRALVAFAAFWFLLTGLLCAVVRDYQRSRRRNPLPMLNHYRERGHL
jgi:hypothetical protein